MEEFELLCAPHPGLNRSSRNFALGRISDYSSEDFYEPQMHYGETDFAKT
jgi:hypothetical protein